MTDADQAVFQYTMMMSNFLPNLRRTLQRPRSAKSRTPRRSTAARRRELESLEPRYTRHGAPVPWDNASALTLSFAPDGTIVGEHVSTLNATLSPVESTAQWQAAIALAFQTWAQYANINVGVVTDSGLPLGIRGVSHGDDRFGDIRVAGTPMSPDTLAAAIDQTRLASGTWTGDVLFNTSGEWNTPNDIFSAALHEAGHVLGLAHSSEPDSPMFTHGVSANLVPTANDIQNIRALYGARTPDENERTQDNDTIGRATRLRFAEPADGFDGTLPLVQFGDLHATTDADFFLLPVLVGYSDSLTFEVRSEGLSLLAPRITLFDKNGVQLAQQSFHGTFGGTASATISGPFGERVYARVDAATTNEYSVGGYSLVVKYDGLNTVPEASVAHAVAEGFRWRGLTDDTFANIDIRPFLQGSEPPHLDEDAGTDDHANAARRLKPVVDTAEIRKYQYLGAISRATDLDYYVLRSPSFNDPVQRNLTVTIESLKLDGVIGDIRVLDDHENPLPIDVVANGTGLVVVRVAAIKANKDYTVEVSTRTTHDGPTTGNYALTGRFDDVPLERTTFLSASVSPATPLAGYQLYVARTQLFNFALESTAASGSAGASVWVVIYDSRRRPVFLAASVAGTTRSAPSVLLDPGEYYVQVAARQPDGLTPASATLTLMGEQATDPVGPPVVDPGTPPIYRCEVGPSPYCYPGGVTNVTPYAFVPGPPLPTVNPPPDVTNYSVVDPGDAWFWHNFHTGNNPLLPTDVNGDTLVTPLDALLVVNQLNDFGAGSLPPPPIQSPFLDVSADLLVAPLDALMVINSINGIAAAEGEPASINPPPLNPATESSSPSFAAANLARTLSSRHGISATTIDAVLADENFTTIASEPPDSLWTPAQRSNSPLPSRSPATDTPVPSRNSFLTMPALNQADEAGGRDATGTNAAERHRRSLVKRHVSLAKNSSSDPLAVLDTL